MHWFKILLLVWFAWATIRCLIDVGKGKFTTEGKPIVNAIAALISVLLGVGVALWL